MPAIFEDIEIEWKGVPYRIAGDDGIMRALAIVEDHITFTEIINGQNKGNIPLAKIAAAYAAVLRCAGARVTAAEVYAGMWEGGADAAAVTAALTGLMEMMIPPTAIPDAEEETVKKKPTRKKSSKPRSKRL